MLQRIQTIYLLIITVLSAIMLFFPQAGLLSAEWQLEISSRYIFYKINAGSGYFLIVILLTVIEVVIPVISLTAMLLFKKRILQIRLIIINIILMAGVYAIIFVYLLAAAKTLQADWYLNIVAVIPLINIVLSFMAIRAIDKDETLVKSLDRLR